MFLLISICNIFLIIVKFLENINSIDLSFFVHIVGITGNYSEIMVCTFRIGQTNFCNGTRIYIPTSWSCDLIKSGYQTCIYKTGRTPSLVLIYDFLHITTIFVNPESDVYRRVTELKKI